MKRVLRSLLVVATISAALTGGSARASVRLVETSKESQACIDCHKKHTPSIVKQWKNSGHADAGVGCFECHKAEKTDPDAMKHHGFIVSAIVSPKDCGQCHPKETKEFTNSYHAQGGKFVYGAKNVLGMVITGMPNNYFGCAGCHGAKVEIGKDGKPLAGTWPNNGIGRFNPDGSIGSCAACHYSHSFSLAQARDPKTCGKCHQGPDHPDIEIYELSKHGIAWEYHHKDMEKVLERKDIKAGEDYYQAPACFTCHMGSTATGVKGSHDVGMKSSWNIRGPISKRTKNWQKKRELMKKTCMACHTKKYVDNYFRVYDEYIKMYNEKFAIPAKEVMTFMYKHGVLDKTPFNESLEWDYWHLWHHEGRRARHGAAMMGADYSHWQGIYLVAYNFYFKLLPEADKLIEEKFREGKIDKATVEAWKKLEKEILSRKEHKWIHSSFEEIKKMEKENLKAFMEAVNK